MPLSISIGHTSGWGWLGVVTVVVGLSCSFTNVASFSSTHHIHSKRAAKRATGRSAGEMTAIPPSGPNRRFPVTRCLVGRAARLFPAELHLLPSVWRRKEHRVSHLD